MLRGIWRKGSLAWRVVLYAAFLAMGLFVTFDLLDLDGSQLQGRMLPRGTITAAFISDAEDVSFEDPSRLDPTLLDISWHTLRALDGSSRFPGKLTRTSITAKLDSVRRHPLPRTGTSPARPAAEDPY